MSARQQLDLALLDLAQRGERPRCACADCERPVHGKGYCSAHYLRLKRTGSLELRRRATVPERFWRSVDERGPDECWLWTGQKNNQGYGRFNLAWNPDVRVLAHRFAYELTSGDDIRARVLMHSCDNPACVNPSHLTPGTQHENMRDAARKGRCRTTPVLTLPPRPCKGCGVLVTEGRRRYCEPCRAEAARNSRARYRAKNRKAKTA